MEECDSIIDIKAKGHNRREERSSFDKLFFEDIERLKKSRIIPVFIKIKKVRRTVILKHFKLRLILISAVFLSAGFQSAMADFHLIKETSLEWVDGSRTIKITTEIWKTKDKEFRNTGRKIDIIRHDLKKIWELDPQTKTYTEKPMDKKGPLSPASPFSREGLHNEGYDYMPEYSWTLQSAGDTRTIHGLICRKFVLDGDADYAEKHVELWVTDGIGMNLKEYGDVRSYFVTLTLTEVEPHYEALKNSWVLSESVSVDPAIAPQRNEDFSVKTIEEADPPDRIYEIPEGYTKSSSKEERGPQ